MTEKKLYPWDEGFVKPAATALKTEAVEAIEPITDTPPPAIVSETAPVVVEKRAPGRPVGSKNKATTKIRQAIADAIDENIESLLIEINQLPTLEKSREMRAWAEFIIPKKQRTEIEDADGNVVPLKQVFFIGNTKIEF